MYHNSEQASRAHQSVVNQGTLLQVLLFRSMQGMQGCWVDQLQQRQMYARLLQLWLSAQMH
jgi:hypothetical protein